MKEIKGKSILVRDSEGSIYQESSVTKLKTLRKISVHYYFHIWSTFWTNTFRSWAACGCARTRLDEGRIKMASEFKAKVGFLGGGNMAKAMAKGFIKSKTVNPANIIVSATTEKTLSLWKVRFIKLSVDRGRGSTLLFWHVGNPREKYCCPTTISYRETLARKSISRRLRQKTKILWLLECRQYNKDCEEKKKKRKKHVHCRTARHVVQWLSHWCI